MDEIPFEIVLKGKIKAYSKEHAEDEIHEFFGLIREYFECRFDTLILLNEKTHQISLRNENNWGYEISEKLQHFFTQLTDQFINELEEMVKKPPIFDRTDYVLVREQMLDKIRDWRVRDWGRYGSSEREKEVEKLSNDFVDELVGELKELWADEVKLVVSE